MRKRSRRYGALTDRCTHWLRVERGGVARGGTRKVVSVEVFVGGMPQRRVRHDPYWTDNIAPGSRAFIWRVMGSGIRERIASGEAPLSHAGSLPRGHFGQEARISFGFRFGC